MSVSKVRPVSMVWLIMIALLYKIAIKSSAPKDKGKDWRSEVLASFYSWHTTDIRQVAMYRQVSAYRCDVTRMFQNVVSLVIASKLTRESNKDDISWKSIRRYGSNAVLTDSTYTSHAYLTENAKYNRSVRPCFFVTFLVMSQRYADNC